MCFSKSTTRRSILWVFLVLWLWTDFLEEKSSRLFLYINWTGKYGNTYCTKAQLVRRENRTGGQDSATCFGWSGPGPKQRSGHHYLHRGVWTNLHSAIVLQPDVSVIIIISAFFAALHNLSAALVNSASDTYWLIWLELGRARHVSRRVLDILVTKTNNGRYVPDYYILSLINIS